MKTISKKIDSENWHIYNLDSKKHIVIGYEEKKLLDNKDNDFLIYLKEIDFNVIEKKSILDIKFSIFRKSIQKNFFTSIFEKVILTTSFILFVSFVIWTTIFQFTYKTKNEINFFEYYIISIISIFIHEIFHYIFLINRDVLVPEIGIRMKFLIPIFSMYVDSSGIEFINIRRKLQIFLSGLLAHLNIFLIFFYLNAMFKIKLFYDISNINLFLLLFNSLWIWNQDGKQIIKIYLGLEMKSTWVKVFDLSYSIALICLFFTIKG